MIKTLNRINNRILHVICQFIPGATTIRPFLHRMRGVKIYGKVFIGDQVYIENECPECVEIHEGVQIGIRSIILAHFRGSGKVIIEKNVFIGPNCVITCSPGRILTIGEGSVIAAASVITFNIPPGILYSCQRAMPVAKVTIPMTIDTSYKEFVGGLRPITGNAKDNK